MTCLTVRKINNSYGVTFPAEISKKLKCAEGDKLYVLETKHGIELIPYDCELAKEMEHIDAIITKNEDVLRELAK